MKRFCVLVLPCFLFACSASDKKGALIVENELSKELKEISGITANGSDIWAITDKPHARFYRLDLSGKIKGQIEIHNVDATDVEAVASDDNFMYIGDIGDNSGDRMERKIIKVAKPNIIAGNAVKVTGEIIEFNFAEKERSAKKKQNNFDCESLISYKDSLYVFTKDRQDKETQMFALPKTRGKYTARFINSFNSDGLVTDAALSPATNELALIGYRKGHRSPFILLFSDFSGNDFFSGTHKKINLADNKERDWQVEGISYGDNNMMYFTCEGTKQVPATFYGIKRDELHKIDEKTK